MDFDDISEFQGWSVASQLLIALDFISARGLDSEFDAYAQACADAENGV